MNKQEIITAINDYIKTNGVQDITGQVMNLILSSIANIIPDDTMLTSSFGGIVKPTEPIMITPGTSRWFIAKAGNYPNNGGFTFEAKNLNILSYDGAEWDENQIELPAGATVVDGFSSSSIAEAGSAKNDKLLSDAIKTLDFTPPTLPQTPGSVLDTESTGSPTNYTNVNGVVHVEKGVLNYSAKPIKFNGNKINYSKDGAWVIFGNLANANNVYIAASFPVGTQNASIVSFYQDATYFPTTPMTFQTLVAITAEPKFIIFKSDKTEFYQGSTLFFSITHAQTGGVGLGGFGEKRFGLVADSALPILDYTFSIWISDLSNPTTGIKVQSVNLSQSEIYGNDVQIVAGTLKKKFKRFQGKKVALYGDSITVGYDSVNYENQIKAKLEAGTVIRKGESGQSFTGNLQNNTNLNALVSENADLIILHSVNDHRSGAVVGTMADASGSASMIGGLKKICNALVSQNKNVKIILCTPLTYGGVSGGWENVRSDYAINGKYLFEYTKAMKDFADCYGITVVDLSKNCGFRPQIEGTSERVFTSDGVHPNILGYQLMTDLIANKANNF